MVQEVVGSIPISHPIIYSLAIGYFLFNGRLYAFLNIKLVVISWYTAEHVCPRLVQNGVGRYETTNLIMLANILFFVVLAAEY